MYTKSCSSFGHQKCATSSTVTSTLRIGDEEPPSILSAAPKKRSMFRDTSTATTNDPSSTSSTQVLKRYCRAM